MQIFLSHSSRQKPLVREIKKCLPEYLGAWIDEEKLLIGDNLSASLEATIQSETDYVLLFLDHFAATSTWVAKEVEWTLKAEKSRGRTILLPIVIDDDAIQTIGVPGLDNRKFLRIESFMESSVRSLAAAIASELFALLCRDMELLRRPKPRTASATLEEAQKLLRRQGALIRKIVFPHRKSNPLSLETLGLVMNSQTDDPVNIDDLESVLSSIVRGNLMPGLVYDGYSLFLSEEHASWKAEMHQEKKLKVGRATAGMIQNGMSVILDAGSTVEEIVRIICKKIENRALTKITIATTSINIADMISDCCVSMGFDDDFSAVRLFVPGGRVRPNTQAVVPTHSGGLSDLERLTECIGKFDLGIIGVNGIDAEAGLTTHDNAEAANKTEILRLATSRIAVGDSSKIGIILENVITDFDDPLKLVLDDNENSRSLRESVGSRGVQILLAQ